METGVLSVYLYVTGAGLQACVWRSAGTERQ